MVFIDQAANTIKCHAERLDKDMGSQTPSLWVYLSSQMGTWLKASPAWLHVATSTLLTAERTMAHTS